MNRAEKQEELQSLRDGFAKAQAAYVADFTGLTVAEITTLRRNLSKTGAKAKVVKNTLVDLSLKDALKDSDQAEVKKFQAFFTGPNFLVFSFDDVVAPAKVVAEFAKSNEKFKVKGGWFEGACVDSKAVEAVSKLPSREEILGKLLSLMNTPAVRLLGLLQAPAGQVVRLIGACKDKLEKEGK